MRLATWNVNSVKARLPRLLDWLATRQPDVLCLQELKVSADQFPTAEIKALGYDAAVHGDGRWNGVAVLSRVGLDDVRAGFDGDPGFPDEAVQETRAVSATCAGLRVWSVYVPNGRTPDDPHYNYKLNWLARLTEALEREPAPLAVCGDFNVAPTDDDVWDPAVFVGATHVTPPERDALTTLRDRRGLRDIVPRPLKGDHPFTYWDYRAGMFHQNKGMRIDLVYATDPVPSRVTDAYVDREARKGKGPSDHAPIVVDIDL
ncbi:exodeoxyribonuclease-3 [Catenuloplanes nepalensis]|uniref:Exodeoxyribonuclease-3 n=1 Tax=Catenuloplanes nepalensis TaxID=587533 RepID=A0ABT9MV33_9ACTN|nr:exodeoxyribonuclease III [Catenuloplanes nepalensis]MDP9795308.1 exodeoxyribonuclease-3 [Catenuloplanes nepalensis]